MTTASTPLLGRHDFATFCKQREGATTIRTLLDLSWERDEAGVIAGTVRADAFCHHMVRSLVGCLVAVGEGQDGQQFGLGAGLQAEVVGLAEIQDFLDDMPLLIDLDGVDAAVHALVAVFGDGGLKSIVDFADAMP